MRNRRARHGQALVEFALILPALMVLLLGVIDGGRLVYAYNAVANAAREAGRSAIVNQDPDAVRAKAAQQATGLSIPTSTPGALDCTDGMPSSSPPVSSVCFDVRSGDTVDDCSPARIGCTAIVSVQWTWQPLTPLIGDLIGPVAVESTTRQQIESVCPRTGVTVCPDR